MQDHLLERREALAKRSRKNVTNMPASTRQGGPGVSVEETTIRLMARKKERQANNRPHTFLSLLDWVRVAKK